MLHLYNRGYIRDSFCVYNLYSILRYWTYTIYPTLYTLYTPLYILHTLYTHSIYYIHYIPHSLYHIHYIPHSIYYIHYIPHSIYHIHYIPHSIYYIHYIPHSIYYIHYIPHSIYYIHYIPLLHTLYTPLYFTPASYFFNILDISAFYCCNLVWHVPLQVFSKIHHYTIKHLIE